MIGKVRGSKTQKYTDGVICAKVARYSERVHHDERLRVPLIQMGAKGESNFTPISWDDALGEIAERFECDSAKYGSESVWPYYYGGTMGYVQRDGINRLRHEMNYSGMAKTICASIVTAGWSAGVGASIGTAPEEISESDLIIVWGTNIVSTQVNVMHHITAARKKRGAKLVVIDPYLLLRIEHLLLRNLLFSQQHLLQMPFLYQHYLLKQLCPRQMHHFVQQWFLKHLKLYLIV